MSTALVKLEQIEKLLASITTVEDAKQVSDEAEALRVYAKRARKGLAIQNRCAYLKLLAQRRAAELLIQIEREPGKRDGETSYQAVIRSAELDPMTSYRWQKLCWLTPAQLEELWNQCDDKCEELTFALVERKCGSTATWPGHVAEDDPDRVLKEHLESKQLLDAAAKLRKVATGCLMLGLDDLNLQLILRDRRYLDRWDVDGVFRTLRELRARVSRLNRPEAAAPCDMERRGSCRGSRTQVVVFGRPGP